MDFVRGWLAAHLKRVSQTTILAAAFEWSWRWLGIGVASAALGLAIDWLRGSTSVAAILGPPLVGAAFVVLYALVLGATVRIAIVLWLRHAIGGQASISDDDVVSNEIRFTWWARAVLAAVLGWLVAFIGLVIFGASMAGLSWYNEGVWPGASAAATKLGEFAAIALGPAAASVVAVLGGDLIFALFDRLAGLLKRILPNQAFAVLSACVVAVIFWSIGLVLVATASRLLPAEASVTPITLGTVLGLAGPCIMLGGSFLFRDPPEAVELGRQIIERGRMTEPTEFKTWNLDAERSHTGTAANGYPFYLWRESADNRIGVSRPRYCTISIDGNDLFFEFFNPAADQKPSGAMMVFFLVGGGLAALSLVSYFVFGDQFRAATAPYHTPPVLAVLGAAWGGSVVGGISAGVWHVIALAWRWRRNRFEGDGRVLRMPWALLESFTELSARDAGAKGHGDNPPTGHGLAAAFTDGSVMILTSNSWERTSIMGTHRELTRLFVSPRDAAIREFKDRLKRAARGSHERPRTEGDASANTGVPDSL
jgi:hypothetical protein